MDRLIIVGAPADPHVSSVVHHLRDLSALEVFYIDLAKPLALDWRPGCRSLSVDGVALTWSDDAVVWWRDKMPLGAMRAPELIRAYRERRVFVRRALEMLDMRWFNPLELVERAGNKLLQLQLAHGFDWKIPETVVSSDADRILDFVGRRPSIMKPMHNPNVEGCATCDTPSFAITTNRVSAAEIQETAADEIAMAPMIYQAEVSKAYEVRVVATQEEVLAYKVDSQRTESGKVDWRHAQYENIFNPMPLEAELARRCADFLSALNIRYGSLDLIVDPEGTWWFLECNPEGQWAWLELADDARPISRMVAEAILSTWQGN